MWGWGLKYIALLCLLYLFVVKNKSVELAINLGGWLYGISVTMQLQRGRELRGDDHDEGNSELEREGENFQT